MSFITIVMFISIIAIMYYLLISNDNNVTNNVSDIPNGDDDIVSVKKCKKKEDSLIYINCSDGNYLAVNPMLKTLFITEVKEEAEIFKLIIVKTRKNSTTIGLFSTTMNQLLTINYTTYYKKEYDVLFDGVTLENNASILKLIKLETEKGKSNVIKFYNGYYLCIDFHGNLHASFDKNKVLLFNIEYL